MKAMSRNCLRASRGLHQEQLVALALSVSALDKPLMRLNNNRALVLDARVSLLDNLGPSLDTCGQH
jgi:hypothetical protein